MGVTVTIFYPKQMIQYTMKLEIDSAVYVYRELRRDYSNEQMGQYAAWRKIFQDESSRNICIKRAPTDRTSSQL